MQPKPFIFPLFATPHSKVQSSIRRNQGYICIPVKIGTSIGAFNIIPGHLEKENIQEKTGWHLEECPGRHKRNMARCAHLANLRIIEAIPFALCEAPDVGTVMTKVGWSWMSNHSKKLILPGSLQRHTNFQCSNSHLPQTAERQQPGQQGCAICKEKKIRVALSILLF